MKPVMRRPRGSAAGAPPAFFVAVAATAAGRSGDRAPFGPYSEFEDSLLNSGVRATRIE